MKLNEGNSRYEKKGETTKIPSRPPPTPRSKNDSYITLLDKAINISRKNQACSLIGLLEAKRLYKIAKNA